MRNVPLDVRIGGLKSQLAGLGLTVAPNQQLQTGLLSGPWNGFPSNALVIWAARGGLEWLAVSNEAALDVE